MNIYTYTKARQNLATLLDQAAQDGQVRIRRRDGQIFVVKPETPKRRGSPLKIKGLKVKMPLEEILSSIDEGRKFR